MMHTGGVRYSACYPGPLSRSAHTERNLGTCLPFRQHSFMNSPINFLSKRVLWNSKGFELSSRSYRAGQCAWYFREGSEHFFCFQTEPAGVEAPSTSTASCPCLHLGQARRSTLVYWWKRSWKGSTLLIGKAHGLGIRRTNWLLIQMVPDIVPRPSYFTS